MKRALLLVLATASLAAPTTAAAQTTSAQPSSSCQMVDSTDPNNWFRINADKSWEARVQGRTYRSAALDLLARDALDATQVNVKDQTGITVDGAPAPPEVRLVGRFFDARDKAKVIIKNVDGATDVKIVDRTAGADAHAFNCAGLAP